MYLKEPAGNGKFTITPLTDENVFSICPVCGVEHQVDITGPLGLVMEGDTEYLTLQVCCPYCTGKIKKEGLNAALAEKEERLSYSLKEARKDDEN